MLHLRPSLLITDAYNVHHNPDTRRTRDEKLMTNILQTLRNGGNVLVIIVIGFTSSDLEKALLLHLPKTHKFHLRLLYILVSGVSVTPCHNKCFNFNFVRFRRYASTLPEESWSSLTWSIRYNSQQNFINLKSLKKFITIILQQKRLL
jgi:hypothetical protein